MICRFSIVLLLWLLGCKQVDTNKPASISKASVLDQLKLTDLMNKPVDLKQYTGKTIFLNIWATWCKPCIAEMPAIQKAQTMLEKEGVVFLLASGENAEEIASFKNANDYNFNYTRIENSEDLNVQTLPTTFIFNAEGELVFSEMGSRQWDDSISIDMIRKIAHKND